MIVGAMIRTQMTGLALELDLRRRMDGRGRMIDGLVWDRCSWDVELVTDSVSDCVVSSIPRVLRSPIWLSCTAGHVPTDQNNRATPSSPTHLLSRLRPTGRSHSSPVMTVPLCDGVICPYSSCTLARLLGGGMPIDVGGVAVVMLAGKEVFPPRLY